MARLFEGFTKSAGSAVRSFFARSGAGGQAVDMRRGGTPSVERAGLPYTLASHYGYDSLAEHLRIDQDLQARYTDYEEMDEYPEISVALDIYADDSCTPSMDREEAIWVTSKDKGTADELNTMLHEKMTIDDDIWGSSRTLCKYGSNYGELLVNENGVVGINYLPPPTMRRVEDTRGNLLGFLQDIRGEFNITMEDFYALAQQRGGDAKGSYTTVAQRNRAPGELTVFEDWEVIHWRLRGKHLRSVYGHAVIDPARWVWKRLALLEDALLIYKLERAPSRYAFYIDVGQLDAERGLAHVNRVKNQFTRKKFVNPSTGKLDMRYNPLCLHGDTEVLLLSGEVKTIKEMVECFERGDEQWVWSTDLDDEGKIRPGKVVWAGKTRRNAQLVKVTLDNGKSVVVTPDHKMIRRDCSKVEAQHLCSGDSLMSYELVYIGGNHKVVSVEFLEERADTYTLTVENTHTFAVQAGVFVCNSHDEDFFIPVRDGKRTTEVDIIQGPDYTETDSLEYHRDKLVASIKVPKMYYGYGGEAVENQLSTRDIRFARSVMRVQQCLRGGYRKGCRVHLIAIGRDPDQVDYQVNMSVPSSILELARMEVMNTTADLASRMQEMVGTKWVLEHLFHFTEEEAAQVMEAKNEEKLKDGAVEAQIQKLQMSSSDDEVSGGAPPLFEGQKLEKRLSQMIKAVEKRDWRRDFDSKSRTTEKRAANKLDQLLRENVGVNKRIREIGGLLVDIRKTMRAEASP